MCFVYPQAQTYVPPEVSEPAKNVCPFIRPALGVLRKLVKLPILQCPLVKGGKTNLLNERLYAIGILSLFFVSWCVEYVLKNEWKKI